MSDLHKQLMKNRTGKPPMQNPPKDGPQDDSDEDEEEMKDQFQANKEVLPPQMEHHHTNHPVPIKAVHNLQLKSNEYDKPAPSGPKKKIHDYSPLPWTDFFDEMIFMDNGTPLYIAGKDNSPIFLCLHGAGHSSMSFACVAQKVKHFSMCVAFDYRAHGEHKVNNYEMSIDQLIKDTEEVVDYISKVYDSSNIIIIGHSMGGAVATKATEALLKGHFAERIQGLIVIDVVEGSAIEALPFMENIVQQRPKQFKTYEQAIQWAINTTTVRNVQSARVSIPPQLSEVRDDKGNLTKLVWKVDLMKTEPYWMGWFKGLTQSFLQVRIPKILMLAEKERLDKDLTVAQMQGKFKLVILYDTGHSIQEDDPMNTAAQLHDFLIKFRIPLTVQEHEYVKQHGIGSFHPAVKPFQQKQ